MGQSLYLRKMAFKSVFSEGKYAGATVLHVIEMKNQAYLRYIYYNYSNLSFTDDVLERIGIIDMQIDKPGKDPISGKYVEDYIVQYYGWKVRAHMKTHMKKKAKGKLAHINKMRTNSEYYLQAKNHGH